MSSYQDFQTEKQQIIASGTRLVFPRHGPFPHLSTSFMSSKCLMFNIYPRTDHDLSTNDFLWHLIRSSSFTDSQLRPHLQPCAPLNPLLAVAFPPLLSKFLLDATIEHMRFAIIYMLADAAQGESEVGYIRMSRELHPAVWRDVMALLDVTTGQRGTGIKVNSSVTQEMIFASYLLDSALQTAATHDFWKISLELAFAQTIMVGSQPVTDYDYDTQKVASECWKHVEKRYADAQAHWGLGLNPTRSLVFQSLYEDWLLCVNVYMGRFGRELGEHKAMQILRVLVRCRRQGVWDRVNGFRRCAGMDTSYTSRLAPEIVEQNMIPIILDEEAKEAMEDFEKGYEAMKRMTKAEVWADYEKHMP